MTFIVPFPGISRVTRTFLSANAVAETDTTQVFTDVNFGGVSADRYLLAFVGTRAVAAATISACSIGGVAATEVPGTAVTGGGTGTTKGKAFLASVPTGLSGDISITVSTGPAARYNYSLYALFGLGSTTASDTKTDLTTPLSVSLDVPANGVGLAAMFDESSATSTWAGFSEDVDGLVSTISFTSASLEATAAQSGLTVSCTPTAAGAPVFIAVSFGP